LIDCPPARRAGAGEGVVVQLLPAGAGVAGARLAEGSQDGAVAVQLIEAPAGRRDGNGRAVVVQALPARTGLAGARRPRVAPDPAAVVPLEGRIGVQLIEGAAAGR